MKFNGKEITKIEELPENMRHLWNDAQYLICSKCGRKSYVSKINSDCNMIQPDGSICTGIFIK